MIALVGFGVAWYLYLGPGRPSAASRAGRARCTGPVANKFYVDEFYDSLIVRPSRLGSRFLWRVVDACVIDKLVVNGSALVTRSDRALVAVFPERRRAALRGGHGRVALVGLLWVFLG